MIALDYKLNFTPELSDGIPALHARVSERVYDLFTTNGGLYIKIGMYPLVPPKCPPLNSSQAKHLRTTPP